MKSFNKILGIIIGIGLLGGIFVTFNTSVEKSNDEKTVEKYHSELEGNESYCKKQKIEKIDLSDQSIVDTLDKEEDVKSFVTALNIENWKQIDENNPNYIITSPKFEFIFSQTPTKQIINKDQDLTKYKENMRITTYENSNVVTEKIFMFEIEYLVPDETIKLLNS